MLTSIFFGKPQVYELGSIRINFSEQPLDAAVFGNSLFGKATNTFLSSSIAKVVTLGYLHVLIHEMGHATMDSLLNCKIRANIQISTLTCQGNTLGGASSKLVFLAGPVAGVSLELAKLAASVALVTFAPLHIAVPVATLLTFGALIWIFGEFMYALSGNGDWAEILN